MTENEESMKFLTRFILFVVVLFLGCGDGNIRPPHSRKVSIAYLKSLYKGIPMTITDDIAIRGWVVSYDGAGEWYKTLVIEDESGGIVLKLDETNVSTKYPVDRIVEVNCNNLRLDSYGGTLQLDNITTHITATEGVHQNLLTKTIKIADLNPQLISRFIRIDSLQFATEEVGQRLGIDTAYTNRHLFDNAGDTIILRISPRANHINYTIPSTEILVKGIVSYFNGDYEIVINRINDLFVIKDNGILKTK